MRRCARSWWAPRPPLPLLQAPRLSASEPACASLVPKLTPAWWLNAIGGAASAIQRAPATVPRRSRTGETSPVTFPRRAAAARLTCGCWTPPNAPNSSSGSASSLPTAPCMKSHLETFVGTSMAGDPRGSDGVGMSIDLECACRETLSGAGPRDAGGGACTAGGGACIAGGSASSSKSKSASASSASTPPTGVPERLCVCEADPADDASFACRSTLSPRGAADHRAEGTDASSASMHSRSMGESCAAERLLPLLPLLRAVGCVMSWPMCDSVYSAAAAAFSSVVVTVSTRRQSVRSMGSSRCSRSTSASTSRSAM
mmetsp:Transcript_6248/g.25060  ORF Transcript_6248/g.25060 Transcript_6248/m.25060 type:complete len:315 (-) Transcript_6248:1306-2250(-)